MFVPRILVVDDSAFQRQVIKKILTDANFEIAGEAANGKEAVEKYMKLCPNLVTLDMTMPDMNGLEALRALKALDANAKVVMVTAMGYKDNVEECKKIGASGFLVKPFQPEKLVQVVQDIFSKSNN